MVCRGGVCADQFLPRNGFFRHFHRRFKVELESKRKFNVRSRDLLVNCGLEDCILQNSEADYAFRDQWEEPDRKLGSMRDRSLAYIRMIAQRAADREEQTQR